MQKIVPHLWFDKEAKEAAEFYVSVFPNSKIINTTPLHDSRTEAEGGVGDSEFVTFSLNGYEFMAISAGPYFKVNPSISFFVNFDPSRDPKARENLDTMWDKLSEGGVVLMPLQEYPFSKHYGWIQDKFGVTWQLILTDPDGEERPFIVPSLLFVKDVCGKAEEAMDFYLSVFKNSKKGMVSKYPAGMELDKEGTVMYADFKLEGEWLTVMDSAQDHKFQFTEGISLLVRCEDQAEIDELWEKLSAVPESEQCGWLKDKYGVSWQISPAIMDEMLTKSTPEQKERVTQAFLKMKKFDLAEIQRAYEDS
jgi:predicted 3-demethylubiquinone-9 3-methyltransferase (glyoxalase superfamily)